MVIHLLRALFDDEGVGDVRLAVQGEVDGAAVGDVEQALFLFRRDCASDVD